MLKSTSFIFDGQSSDDYGVMIYFLNDDSMVRELEFGTDVSIVEDRPSRLLTPIHYGTNVNSAMSFPLTFGSPEHLSDFEVDAIAGWLTGHSQYKWLEYVESDHYVRYKCFINNLKTIYVNGLATAFEAEVVCDSQFAYEYPMSYTYEVSDTPMDISFFNKSSYAGYLKPNIDIYFDDDCSSLSIVNRSDKDREFKIDYFDRFKIDENQIDFIYDTSLDTEFSKDNSELQNFSWQELSIPSGSYNELLYGDGIYVLLPKNSDKAQVSIDMGVSWQEVTFPVSGTFTGCYGVGGFVAIQTDAVSNVVLNSNTGVNWIQAGEDSCLPVEQHWKSVCFAKLGSFADGYYIAVGDSAIAAASLSGLNWQSLDITLPGSNWSKVAYGNGKAIAFAPNSNKIAYCTSPTSWRERELPITANWTDIVYGDKAGWIIVCDSTSTSPQQPVYVVSDDGFDWKVGELPINSWQHISYAGNAYIAATNNSYALSLDGINWTVNTMPYVINDLSNNTNSVIALSDGRMFISSLLNMVEGSFSFNVSETNIMNNVIITAKIENASDVDANYVSNGELQLYVQNDNVETQGIPVLLKNENSDNSEIEFEPTQEEIDYANMTYKEMMEEAGDTEGIGNDTEFDYVILTQDTRTGLGVEGVKAKAEWDPDNKVVTIHYVCDPNHTAVMDALMTIKVSYNLTVVTDLGMEQLHVSFDKNQIINVNRDSLNIYEYFNKKYFRLLKGANKLTLKTDGGTAKVVITCEFLRKVGGF